MCPRSTCGGGPEASGRAVRTVWTQLGRSRQAVNDRSSPPDNHEEACTGPCVRLGQSRTGTRKVEASELVCTRSRVEETSRRCGWNTAPECRPYVQLRGSSPSVVLCQRIESGGRMYLSRNGTKRLLKQLAGGMLEIFQARSTLDGWGRRESEEV